MKKDEGLNVEEFLKVEVTNVILKERNKPNLRLMAKALLDLRKGTLK